MTRRMLRTALGLSAILLTNAAPAAEPTQPRNGVLYVVGGVGAIDPLIPSAKLTLHHAGATQEIRVFEWKHPKGWWLRNLQDWRYFQERAAELAVLIREQLEREPDRPIYLMGHSGGGGIVLGAAELLPPASVERIILLSPAVSSHYDLRPALKATRCEIVSFNSTGDRLVLDWMTSLFGTVDRYYEAAAGLNGFEPPAAMTEADQQLYRRLVQVPWRLEKLLEFQGWMHNSTTMPLFLAKQVTPWLTK